MSAPNQSTPQITLPMTRLSVLRQGAGNCWAVVWGGHPSRVITLAGEDPFFLTEAEAGAAVLRAVERLNAIPHHNTPGRLNAQKENHV